MTAAGRADEPVCGAPTRHGRSTGARPGAQNRIDGYAALRNYAVIGDGRTVALVAVDGSIDWLCLPDLDSPAVLGALLDAESGGSFTLRPVAPFTAERRYLPGTNVLETTMHTSTGVVRVTDAMTLPGGRLSPQREVVRAVDALAGTITMQWKLTPRFDFGAGRARLGRRGSVPVATQGAEAIALCSWGAGDPRVTTDSIGGRFDAVAGDRAVFALSAAHQEPLVLPGRADVETRLAETGTAWRQWSDSLRYEGRWRDAVVRSALALKLLVHAPSGAVAAAPTTSLPEWIGGDRNWDYRFCWVRDSVFTLGALLRLGCFEEADAFFWWLMQASQLTHPRLQVLYRLDGGAQARERRLPLPGYRSSAPVRVGNAASGQSQLDVYGDLFQAVWLYAAARRPIDADIGRRLAEIADLVCRIWREPDAGLWEVRSEPLHFTQSKMMCFVALDRAVRLAEAGQIPARHIGSWRAGRTAIHDFVETQCWSETKGTYTRHAGSNELDASVLLAVLYRYGQPTDPRLLSTVDAVRRELAHGPFVYRYSGEDGLAGKEGAFLTCSFWLAEAMAVQGRTGEAADLMGRLVNLANDVGLFGEEIDPTTGEFLGNLPQGLTHLALIHAALAFDESSDE